MPFPIALLKADEIIARLLACTIPITEIPDSLPPKLLPPPCLPPPSPTLFSLGPVAQPATCNPPCLTPPSQSLHHRTWRRPASQSPSAPPPPAPPQPRARRTRQRQGCGRRPHREGQEGAWCFLWAEGWTCEGRACAAGALHDSLRQKRCVVWAPVGTLGMRRLVA